MRILHFSTNDIIGGAARAAFRMHMNLRKNGQCSQMIVRYKHSEDPDVYEIPSALPSRFRRLLSQSMRFRARTPYASRMYNFDVEQEIDEEFLYDSKRGKPDIICLHWITNLLTVKTIARLYEHYRCPIAWTLMDQEPLTGGCHYAFDCDGFAKQCGNCPQLAQCQEMDHSRMLWLRKHELLCNLPITFIAPTRWIMDRARQSSLFGSHRIEKIPLGIDETVFRPFDQRTARDLLHIPQDKKVIYFGAYTLDDPRKGMPYLLDALNQLSSLIAINKGLHHEDLVLLSAGLRPTFLASHLPFLHVHLGYLNDDVTIALAYQASDLFACPSTQDAGPLMIPESLLCGTPVVAFDSGGAPDLVKTGTTGYLAALRDSKDLANGIWSVVTNDNPVQMRTAAHQAAAALHKSSVVTEQQMSLFRSMQREQ